MVLPHQFGGEWQTDDAEPWQGSSTGRNARGSPAHRRITSRLVSPVPLQASHLAQLINFVCTRPDSGTIKLRAVVFISGRSRPAGSTTGAARLGSRYTSARSLAGGVSLDAPAHKRLVGERYLAGGSRR